MKVYSRYENSESMEVVHMSFIVFGKLLTYQNSLKHQGSSHFVIDPSRSRLAFTKVLDLLTLSSSKIYCKV